MYKKPLFIIGSIIGALVIGSGATLVYIRTQDAKECTSIERINWWSGECEYECATQDECDDKQKRVDTELDRMYGKGKTLAGKTGDRGPSFQKPTTSTPATAPAPIVSDDVPLVTFSQTESETRGVLYTVLPGSRTLKPQPTSTHATLWEQFKTVVGDTHITKYVQSFEVFDDANNTMAASVWRSQSPNKFHVSVNKALSADKRDFTHTLVHEYGHMLTLNAEEIPGSVEGACPTFMVSEGCSSEGSILNGFYAAYWKKFGANVPKDEGRRQEDVETFYTGKEDEFVSEYAASNAIEDIAESWAVFVLSPRATGATIRDQKQNYFYSKPALVQLRTDIRARLGSSIK